MSDPLETPKRRWDHGLVGVLGAMTLTAAFAAFGGFLLLEGDSTDRRHIVPESLRLPGLILMLFSGVAGAVVAIAGRGFASRRGWPRAARGALWTSAVAAALNVVFVALLAYSRWRSLS